MAKCNLAETLRALKRFDEAVVLQKELLAAQKDLHVDSPQECHPNIANAMTALACTYRDMGNFKFALVLDQQCVAMWRVIVDNKVERQQRRQCHEERDLAVALR